MAIQVAGTCDVPPNCEGKVSKPIQALLAELDALYAASKTQYGWGVTTSELRFSLGNSYPALREHIAALEEKAELLAWADANRFKFGPSNGYGVHTDGWWYRAKDGRHEDAGTLEECLRAAKESSGK